MLPGYAAAAGQQANLGTIGATATRCVNDTYRANTVAYHNANGVSCTLCSTIMTGLETLPGVTGATSAYQCLVPPGRGWPSSGTELDHCSGGKVWGCLRCQRIALANCGCCAQRRRLHLRESI